MSVQGIDVSDNNGTIDWHKVALSKDFAFVKVNEGDFIAKTGLTNARNAKAAGLLVGGYDFLRPRPGRTGAQEFDIFYKYAKHYGLLQKGSARPVADVEATDFTGPFAAYRTRRYVYSWIDRCVARTGHHPIVYTGKWFWEDTMKAKNPHGCKLWLAAYTQDWRKLLPFGGWDHASFHQYTDHGTVPGIAGHVDLNEYLSDRKALIHGHTLKHDS